MKKTLILTLLILLAAVGGFAQTKSKLTKSKGKITRKVTKPAPAKGVVKMDNGYTVSVKQKETVKAGDLQIEFVTVEDSRCPIGVQCIWAGNGKVQIKVSKAGKAAETLALNTNLEPKTVDYQGYKISLIGLDPHPSNNSDQSKTVYTANLSVVMP